MIATPDFWHAPMTNTCLKAGLHVYCEKMMSNTIDGARSMVQTMRETGKLLQIGHQRRSNPRYLFTLNRLLHEAQFCGRLTAAQAQWNRAVKEDFGWPKKYEMPAEHAGQIRLQGHAPVPQLALVQGTRRRAVVRSGRASDRHFQLVDGHAQVGDRPAADWITTRTTTGMTTRW
jgi:predicted dehydrogenase